MRNVNVVDSVCLTWILQSMAGIALEEAVKKLGLPCFWVSVVILTIQQSFSAVTNAFKTVNNSQPAIFFSANHVSKCTACNKYIAVITRRAWVGFELKTTCIRSQLSTAPPISISPFIQSLNYFISAVYFFNGRK